MSDPSSTRLVGHGALYLLSSFLQRGMQFFLLPVAARVLDDRELGELGLALVVGMLVTAFGSVGINAAVTRFYYDEPAGARREPRLWSGLAVTQIVLSILVGTVVFATGPLWGSAFSDVSWGPTLRYAVVFGVLQSWTAMGQSIVRAAQRPYLFVGMTIVQIAVAAPLAYLGAREWGADGYVAGLAAGVAASAVLALGATLHRPRFVRRELVAAVGIALPFLAHWLGTWVLGASDRILVERLDSIERAGAYFVAYALGTVPLTVLQAGHSAWAPSFYSGASKVGYEPAVLARQAVGVVSALALVGIAVGTVGLDLVYPDADRAAHITFGIVTATAVVLVPYLLGITALLDAKLTRAVAPATVAAAVSNIGLNLVLIPVWGIAGAAVATVAAYTVLGFLVTRAVRTRVPEYAPPLGPAVVAGTAVAVVGASVGALDGRSAGAVALGALGATVAAGVALGLLWRSRSATVAVRA